MVQALSAATGFQSEPTKATRQSLRGPPAGARVARGALAGAFVILDTLARAEDGFGLSGLARASGLAKSSAYRLAEQLAALGAVQRVGGRYYIGPRVAGIGQRWQPDPGLRQAARKPVHHLAVQAHAMAAVRILHGDTLKSICATVPHGHAWIPLPTDPESTARTATGRVLYATRPTDDKTPPGSWTPRQWRLLREHLRDSHATVVDCEDAFPGVWCVSAPVWRPNGTCAGAVSVVLHTATPTPTLRDLVVCAARSIGAGLR